jgi:hypothetical protein
VTTYPFCRRSDALSWHGAGRHYPFDWLTRDRGDGVEVAVIVNNHGAVDLAGRRDQQIGKAWASVLPAPDQFSLNLPGAVGHRAGERKLLIKVGTIRGDRVELGEVACAVANLQVDDRRRGETPRSSRRSSAAWTVGCSVTRARALLSSRYRSVTSRHRT